MKHKTFIKLNFINGLKQEPKELDFCITPVLKFGMSNKEEVGQLGSGWGLFIEWGY